MSISQYSPDGKFESGSFMNGMWSGPQGTDPRGGLFNQPSNNQGSNYTNVTLELAPNAGEFGQLIYNSFLINQRDGKSQLYNGGIKGG